MHSIVRRLILWIAEILDRNLVTVPDVDLFDGGGYPRKRPPLAAIDQAADLANSSWQAFRW